jgi:hypothetical protein
MKFIEVKNSGTNKPELINTDHITKLFYAESGDIRINLVDGSYTYTKFAGDLWELLES